jgi:PPP family 3-phenylpropionic acid transporter
MSALQIPKLSGRARAAAFYFCFMAAGGAIGPFLYLLYRRHGLTPGEIGIVIAVAHVMNFFVSPTWGAASDAMERRGGMSLLALACLGAGPSILVLQAVRGLVPTLGAVVLWGFFGGSIISLADAATMRMLGEDRHVYGRVRVWGSVGAVIASLFVGQLGDRLGLEIVFPTYTVMLLLCALMAFSFPRARYQTTQQLSLEALRLFRHPRIVFFLGSILLLGTGYLSWRSTFSLYLEDLGGSAGLIGAFYALGSLVEIPIIAISGRWLDRLGAWRSLFIAFSVFVLLWLGCSLINAPQWAIPLALVHGFSFAVYQVSGVVYIGEVSPPEYAGMTQGAYGSFSRGLGSILGSLTGGALFQSIGGAALYRVSAVLGLFSLLFLWLIPASSRIVDEQRSKKISPDLY